MVDCTTLSYSSLTSSATAAPSLIGRPPTSGRVDVPQDRFGGFERAVDVVVGMGRRDRPLLEPRAPHRDHPAVEHAEPVVLPLRRVAAGGLAEVRGLDRRE